MATNKTQGTTPTNNVSLKIKSVSGSACMFIPLDMKVKNADKIIITGIPDDGFLNVGTKKTMGTWEIDPGSSNNLKIMPPPNYSGELELNVEAMMVSATGDTHTVSEKLVITVYADDEEQQLREKFTPATSWGKFWVGFLLILSTSIVVVFWFSLFSAYSTLSSKKVYVNFKLSEGYVLRSGPAEFRYVAEIGKERLIHIGTIDNDKKKVLIGLLSKLEGSKNTKDESTAKDLNDSNNTLTTVLREEHEYWSAIDSLTYQSHSEKSLVLKMLLLLAGISGVLGVQIRSIINFIGVTCFKNSLDIKRWWPWYILRPVQGFMLGLLAVLIIKAGIFIPNGSAPSGTNWWLAITILVGFGAEDFTERLRLVSQAMFGKTKN